MNHGISLKQNGKVYFGWYIVFVCILLMFFAYAGIISVVSVFVLPVTQELNISRVTFMTSALTIASVISIIISVPSGKLLEKNNIKLIMAVNCVIAFVGYFLLSKATAVWMLMMAYTCLGIAFTQLTTIPISILVNNWFGAKCKGRVMGICFVGSGIGGIALLPITSYFIEKFGWRVAAFSLGLMFVVILLPLVLLFITKTPEQKGFVRMGEGHEQTQRIGNEKGMSFQDAKKSFTLWLVFIVILFGNLLGSGLMVNLVPYFVECNFSSTLASGFAGLQLGSLIIGKPLLGFLCDKLGAKKAGFLSTIFLAVTFLFLCILKMEKSYIVYIVMLFYALGGAGLTVLPPIWVTELFGEKDYGTILGLFQIAVGLGGAFGGSLAAGIFDQTGSYTLFWVLGSAVLFICAIFVLVSYRNKNKFHEELLVN